MNVQSIASALEGTFNQQQPIRKQAEETLKQYQRQPQFAQLLLHLITTAGVSDTVKIAAAIYFKNLARYSWDSREDFHVADSDKAEVRRVVVEVMIACPSMQIRPILSDAIARICEIDFPLHWPNIVTDLVSKFSNTSDLHHIHGALYTAHSIFKKYRSVMELDVKIQQEILTVIQQFAPALLDCLEKSSQAIAQSSGDKKTAEQLFRVLNLITECFYDLNCLDIADWFLANLTKFMSAFISCMGCNFPILASDDDEQPGVLDENKALILQCITLCLEKFDEDFQPYVEKFTSAVWELLQSITTLPKHDNLCVASMAFLTGVSRTIYHPLLADTAKQQMICEKIVIPNMELRESDIEMFEDDPSEYIRRDIEGSDSDTRRRAACDLIQGLSKNYEQTITDIFQRYVGFLTQQYSQNPDNWKAKDTAMYLITALTVRGTTTQRGTSKINELVNIGEFFTQNVLPELKDVDPVNVKYPVVKADCIKFMSSFRLQMPKSNYPLLLQLLVNWLKSPSEVVHSYAAASVERLLMVKEQDGTLRLQKDDWKDMAGTLLQNLFQSLSSSPQENEYIMKAIMRVLLNGQEHVASFVPHILPMLTGTLTQVAKNPQHPTFNHYLFESISALVRYNTVHLKAIEQTVFPIFTEILGSDTPEFMPYVFQIFAQLLEAQNEIPAQYMNLFGPLVNPALYENKGNIPALVRLIKVYIQKAPAQLIAANQLQPILGVFQFLVSSRTQDHEGFNLLNTIVSSISKDQLGASIGTIFNILFTRLMSTKTTKFVKCLLVFFSVFTIKLGADALVEAVSALQGPGLWSQVYANVFLREVQKVSGDIPRRMCTIGLTKLLCESQAMLGDAFYNDLWPQTVIAILKMVELGEEKDAEADHFAGKNTVSVEQLKDQEQGYMNAYCPLVAAAKPEADPCPDIQDEKAFFIASIQKAMQSPHAQKFAATLRTLPGDIQGRLKPILPGVL